MQERVAVILGPTATGKSHCAIELAKRLNCEIISGDSMYVYKGMDIGTAKPTAEEMQGIPHHMIDICEPDEDFSVSRYCEMATPIIDDILARGKTAIIAGGTGLYMDSLIRGTDFAPFPSTGVRERLEQEPIEDVYARLQVIDPEAAARIHPNDEKRTLRALEVFYTTGKPYSTFLTRKTLRNGEGQDQQNLRPFRILKIGLERPREELFSRINTRVDQMVNQGLLHEAMTLLPQREQNALNTVGYKEMFNVLDGTWELQMAIERIKKNTRVYAKKQMTWFKHDSTITWFHPDDRESILKHINMHL